MKVGEALTMEQILLRYFKKAESLDELTMCLARFLVEGPFPNEQGVLVSERKRIDSIGSLRIEIRPKEHAPPHFHVIGPNIDASFTLDDCRLLAGTIGRREHRQIRIWFNGSKDLLFSEWCSSRPSGCPVGEYQG